MLYSVYVLLRCRSHRPPKIRKIIKLVRIRDPLLTITTPIILLLVNEARHYDGLI